MFVNQIKNLNGEYFIVWNNDKKIIMGPETLEGTLFCPVNFYYSTELQDVLDYIETNKLLLPNTLSE